jgi:natural product precursor
MKKGTKITLKKVTLKDLDEPKLEALAGGYPIHTSLTCGKTCPVKTCDTCVVNS